MKYLPPNLIMFIIACFVYLSKKIPYVNIKLAYISIIIIGLN